MSVRWPPHILCIFSFQNPRVAATGSYNSTIVCSYPNVPMEFVPLLTFFETVNHHWSLPLSPQVVAGSSLQEWDASSLLQSLWLTVDNPYIDWRIRSTCRGRFPQGLSMRLCVSFRHLLFDDRMIATSRLSTVKRCHADVASVNCMPCFRGKFSETHLWQVFSSFLGAALRWFSRLHRMARKKWIC